MTKREHKLRLRGLPRCVYSGKIIANKPAVLVEYAPDFLRKDGFLVSKERWGHTSFKDEKGGPFFSWKLFAILLFIFFLFPLVNADLIGYYKFNNDTLFSESYTGLDNDFIYDYSGFFNNGTGYNVSYLPNGSVSGDMAFYSEGYNSYMFGNISLIGLSNVTILGWFKTFNSSGMPLIGWRADSVQIGLRSSDNRPLMYLSNGTDVVGEFDVITLNDESYYFLAMSYNGSYVSYYINNSFVSKDILTGVVNYTPWGPDYFFWLNRQRGGSSLFSSGAIDELRIYNNSFNSSEILDIYASYINCPNLANITLSDVNITNCSNGEMLYNKTIRQYDYCGLYDLNQTFNEYYYKACTDISIFEVDTTLNFTAVIFILLFVLAGLMFYLRHYVASGGVVGLMGFALLFSEFNFILSFVFIVVGSLIIIGGSR